MTRHLLAAILVAILLVAERPTPVTGQAKAAKRCGSTHPPEQNLACLFGGTQQFSHG